MALTRDSNAPIGSVRSRSHRIVEIDVSIDPYEFNDLEAGDNDTEYVVTLHGRILKRMSAYQLRQTLGIAER